LLFLKRVVRIPAWWFVLAVRAVWRRVVWVMGVPVYRVVYLGQRRLRTWYGSAKNRFMFLLCNRSTSTVVAFAVVFVAIAGNVRFARARTDTFDFGTQSLLYAVLHPEDRREIVEEVFRPVALENATQALYAESPLLRPMEGYSWAQPAVVSTTQSMAVLVPMGAEPQPPRRETITYAVEPGDTLSTIAQKFDISLNTLLWANNLSTRSSLRPGQELRILPVSGLEHTVARNQTLSSIAKMYAVDLEAIRTFNALDAGASLSVSQKLIIPGGQRIAPAPVPRTAPSPRVIVTPTKPPPRDSAPTSGASMVWPTELRVLVRGLKWGHTGVDLDCNGRANGTSTNYNFAAQSGVVHYAGWRNGYGQTVEIDHGNGLMTRYGHFYSLAVATGQSVQAGEALGVCGSTGNSTGTHLHFEVIANGRFMDPFNYIR
jgi:murein DD-endopeptidase MepM/ murein hydrolase activator NlpD